MATLKKWGLKLSPKQEAEHLADIKELQTLGYKHLPKSAVLVVPTENEVATAPRKAAAEKQSVVAPAALNEAEVEGSRRIVDIATGRVKGLTEEQFREALR